MHPIGNFSCRKMLFHECYGNGRLIVLLYNLWYILNYDIYVYPVGKIGCIKMLFYYTVIYGN